MSYISQALTAIEGDIAALQSRADALEAAEVGLGVGQSYVDLTGSRLVNTIYTNDTGQTIAVNTQCNVGALEVSADDGATWVKPVPRPGNYNSFFLVPAGHKYRHNGGSTITAWVELR